MRVRVSKNKTRSSVILRCAVLSTAPRQYPWAFYEKILGLLLIVQICSRSHMLVMIGDAEELIVTAAYGSS